MRTRSLERLRRPVPDVSNDISRRDFITGGLSWASLLVACGSNKEARSGSDGSEEPRTFTDDRGRTVSLQKRPEPWSPNGEPRGPTATSASP